MLQGDEHVRAYRETDGVEGHDWRDGTSILLLTTKGRKSGTPRTSALIYGEADGDHVIVASLGGRPNHPAWYLNLDADPDVEVQVRGDVFRARARTATGEERERLWALMVDEFPTYAEYQTRTDRVIPVVVLERTPS